jgi:exopolysaccharide biosynthesis polyprenyl glycosylphosphotransferase
MLQNKQRIQNIILFITDFAGLLLSYYMSGFIWLYYYKGFGLGFSVGQVDSKLTVVIATFLIAYLIHTENEDYTKRTLMQETVSVFKTNIILAAIIAIYQLLDKSSVDFPRGLYVLTIIINVILMLIVREVIKLYLTKKYRNKKRLLVITTSDRADRIVDKYSSVDNWANRLYGIAVIDKDMKGDNINGVPVVANVHDMMTYMKNEIVDEVYISIRQDKAEELSAVVMQLEDMGIIVHIKLETLDAYKDYDMKLEKMGKTPVVTFANRFYDYRKLAIKRIIDIIGSIVGLVIMFIAMIFVAPAIKIESPGPVFFKQKRVGRNGRYFYIYKFRSMYMDAEERKKELMAKNEMSGLMFKMKDDPRITKVGKFIRKTSIDELPQFINVFKGDMSIVGTRPPTVNEFKQYEGHHKRRLSMKPGITGMWQAYGRKTITDFEDIVSMDLDYIDNWSIMLDVKIILRTFIAVFQGG